MKLISRVLTTAILALSAVCYSEEEAPVIKPMTPEQLATKTVRVAAVQVDSPWIWTAPITEDRDPADVIVPYIDRAGEDEADLVVFPELYLGMFRVPSPQTEKVAAAAKKNNINVMVGCFEVFDEEGHYGNSTLIFNREGEIIGRYYKAYQAVGNTPRGWPPQPDCPEWMMTPGQEFPVFDLDFGRVGVLTCYDGYFPEPFRILSLKGAEIIVWPNARGGEIEDYIIRTNVHQNYVHMIATNKSIGAGTAIAQWPGGITKRIDEAEEGYIVDTLNMENLRTARIYGREFHQLRPQIHKEIIQPWKVWEHYGVEPDNSEAPEPDDARRLEILKNIGVEVKEPAEKAE